MIKIKLVIASPEGPSVVDEFSLLSVELQERGFNKAGRLGVSKDGDNIVFTQEFISGGDNADIQADGLGLKGNAPKSA